MSSCSGVSSTGSDRRGTPLQHAEMPARERRRDHQRIAGKAQPQRVIRRRNEHHHLAEHERGEAHGERVGVLGMVREPSGDVAAERCAGEAAGKAEQLIPGGAVRPSRRSPRVRLRRPRPRRRRRSTARCRRRSCRRCRQGGRARPPRATSADAGPADRSPASRAGCRDRSRRNERGASAPSATRSPARLRSPRRRRCTDSRCPADRRTSAARR